MWFLNWKNNHIISVLCCKKLKYMQFKFFYCKFIVEWCPFSKDPTALVILSKDDFSFSLWFAESVVFEDFTCLDSFWNARMHNKPFRSKGTEFKLGTQHCMHRHHTSNRSLKLSLHISHVRHPQHTWQAPAPAIREKAPTKKEKTLFCHMVDLSRSSHEVRFHILKANGSCLSTETKCN